MSRWTYFMPEIRSRFKKFPFNLSKFCLERHYFSQLPSSVCPTWDQHQYSFIFAFYHQDSGVSLNLSPCVLMEDTFVSHLYRSSYIENSRGPKTEPWGTPHWRWAEEETQSKPFQFKVRSGCVLAPPILPRMHLGATCVNLGQPGTQNALQSR